MTLESPVSTWIKRNTLPADDGKGPHATSASGLPPLGLEAKIDKDQEILAASLCATLP